MSLDREISRRGFIKGATGVVLALSAPSWAGPSSAVKKLEAIVMGVDGKGTQGIFDYLAIADNANHIVFRTQGIEKAVTLAEGASRYELKQMTDFLLRYVHDMLGDFDNLVTKSAMKDRRIVNEWTTREELVKNYKYLIGDHREGDPRIYFVNLLCEILQRHEYVSIAKRLKDFEISYRERIVVGANHHFGLTGAEYKDFKKEFEHRRVWKGVFGFKSLKEAKESKSRAGTEYRSLLKQAKWATRNAGFTVEPTLSYFGMRYLTNEDGLKLLALKDPKTDEFLIELPFVRRYPRNDRYSYHRWSSRTEVPKAGRYSPLLAVQELGDGRYKKFLQALSLIRTDGATVDFPTEEQIELAERGFDKRKWANSYQSPEEPSMPIPYIFPLPDVVKAKKRRDKWDINIFDSPFGFVAGIKLGGTVVYWRKDTVTTRDGKPAPRRHYLGSKREALHKSTRGEWPYLSRLDLYPLGISKGDAVACNLLVVTHSWMKEFRAENKKLYKAQ